jgi:hypothetical protein
MAVNDEYTADRDRRRPRAEAWRGPERRIATPAGGQLLEEGDEPAGPIGDFGGSDTARRDQDAPSYGDWVRHSSGTGSGARGHEGEDFPGEHTYGEALADDERSTAMGGREPDRKERGRNEQNAPPASTGERMGKGKTQKGPTGEGQIGNAQTADGGERDRKSHAPGQK